MLYSHIASPTVVANFATFAECIVQKELPHGVDIIVGIHTRLLQAHHPHALLKPTVSGPTPTCPEPVEQATSTPASDMPEAKTGDDTRPCHGSQLGSGVSGSTLGVPQGSANVTSIQWSYKGGFGGWKERR